MIGCASPIAGTAEREKYYQAKVAELYANGKATSIASVRRSTK